MEDHIDWQEIDIRVGQAFRLAAPIDQRALFAGRTEQVRQVVDCIGQPGQHAVIYGERGVGKTSLANVLHEFLQPVGNHWLVVRTNCDSADDFSSTWRKVLAEIDLRRETAGTGLRPASQTQDVQASELLPEPIRPNDIRRLLIRLDAHAIIILDEFDRLPREAVPLVADTIKTLSDTATPATLILVGVADSVDELVIEHASIERAIVQVRMPRMSADELVEIVLRGLGSVEMAIERPALELVASLSQGLPHYTHLLGLHAARQAIDMRRPQVTRDDVRAAISSAVHRAQESIQFAHHTATLSPRPDNLYKQVLLACALAPSDERGFFAAADVRTPMAAIMKRRYEISAFSQHLNNFCDPSRGAILQRTGTRRRYRFRFSNPLMQPYVIMRGLDSNLIDEATLQSFGASV